MRIAPHRCGRIGLRRRHHFPRGGRQVVGGEIRPTVGDWFDPDRILWGYDDEIWDLYRAGYQPVSVLISSDDVVVDGWFGPVDEATLREALDRLRAIG